MRPIPGYPGYYATEDGLIVSKRAMGPRSTLREGSLRYLKLSDGGGEPGRRYLKFTASYPNRKPKQLLVHIAVCSAYHGSKPFDDAIVRHLDGDRKNNRPENLSWGTIQQNMADFRRHLIEKSCTHINAVLDRSIDVAGRRVFLHGNIDETSIGLAIRSLYMLSDMSSSPVELVVSSYGGELEEAFALHDVTRAIKIPIHTVALGKCQSAAPLLVACGHLGERRASENTVFMMHDASLDVGEGSPSYVLGQAEAGRKTMQLMARLLAKYTSKNATHWSRMFSGKTDRYFGAKEAQDWGLIDEIWDEKG